MNVDKVAIIKDRLTMRDVLIRYGFEPKKRMKCPLHGGNDFNFSVMEKGYMCFSHCGGGDVITFVQKLFNLSFPDTLKKIDADFCLGLYGETSLDDFQKNYWQSRKATIAQGSRKQAEEEYNKIYDEYLRLECNKFKYAPKTPDEEPHPLFIEALSKLSYQEYLLECAEKKRYNP